ncbi:MAG TPA: hypothetical protein VFY45_25295, partial [Baekduia sp.]|nr:hypothetical protein [Baekduia sp.]
MLSADGGRACRGCGPRHCRRSGCVGRRGRAGAIVVPPATAPGNPGENQLLPATLKHADKLGLKLKELALDGGFSGGPTDKAIGDSKQQP